MRGKERNCVPGPRLICVANERQTISRTGGRRRRSPLPFILAVGATCQRARASDRRHFRWGPQRLRPPPRSTLQARTKPTSLSGDSPTHTLAIVDGLAPVNCRSTVQLIYFIAWCSALGPRGGGSWLEVCSIEKVEKELKCFGDEERRPSCGIPMQHARRQPWTQPEPTTKGSSRAKLVQGFAFLLSGLEPAQTVIFGTLDLALRLCGATQMSCSECDWRGLSFGRSCSLQRPRS